LSPGPKLPWGGPFIPVSGLLGGPAKAAEPVPANNISASTATIVNIDLFFVIATPSLFSPSARSVFAFRNDCIPTS
jgi:hypothetical protein